MVIRLVLLEARPAPTSISGAIDLDLTSSRLRDPAPTRAAYLFRHVTSHPSSGGCAYALPASERN